MLFLFSASELILKTGAADNGGLAIGWVVEETFRMAAGAETEWVIPVILGGGALAVEVGNDIPDKRPHA